MNQPVYKNIGAETESMANVEAVKKRIDLMDDRAIELKNNIRIYPPSEATEKSEAFIKVQEEAIKECLTRYYNTNSNAQLTPGEAKGKKSIMKRIKDKEIMITYTDKDSRIVISTSKTYKKAA